MRNPYPIAGFCLILAGLWSKAAPALDLPGVPVQCEGCSTVSALEQAALTRGPGTYTIYSLTHNRIIAFQVVDPGSPVSPLRDADGRQAGAAQSTGQIPLPASVAAAFGGLQTLHAASGGSGLNVVRVDAHDLGVQGLGSATIYEVAADANLRFRIANRLASPEVAQLLDAPTAMKAAVEMLVSGLLASFNSRPVPEVIFQIETIDGGIVEFALKLGEHRARLVANGTQTPGGQMLPLPPVGVANNVGTWHGNLDDIHSIADYFRDLGALVGGGGNSRMVCNWDGSSNTLTCNLM